MNKKTLFFGALAIVLGVSCSDPDGHYIPKSGPTQTIEDNDEEVNYDKMKLAWNDEFDGTKVDESKWNYQYDGKPRDMGIVSRKAVALDGKGNLVLKVLKENNTYYMAHIATDKSFLPTYGYFECRAKMNRTLGPHVAFWLQSPTVQQVGDPGENGTEIDIFEYHRKNPDIVWFNLHWDGYGSTHKTTGYKYRYPSVKEGFHTFGLKWTPTKYVFYVDGKMIWSTNQAISNRSEYIVLSTEVQGWGGDPSLGTFPDSVVFDYVRYYKFN